MKFQNEMYLKIPALSVNESFARGVVAAFCLPLNPTLEEINDLKTAVSEAVTNCVVHGYVGKVGDVEIWAGLSGNQIDIRITDHGIGIGNVDEALQPFYTTKPTEERSGMGFTVMQAFMNDVKIESTPNKGTTVRMMKIITSVNEELTEDA